MSDEIERDGDGPLRVYVVEKGETPNVRRLRCVAACPEDSLGFALRTLAEEGQITAAHAIGILDRPEPGKPGRWLVNPFAEAP